MTVKNLLSLYSCLYFFSLYFSHTNFVGFGKNMGLRFEILNACIFVSCALFFYVNKRLFLPKERLHTILGFFALEVTLKILSIISVSVKSNGADITTAVLKDGVFIILLSSLSIVINVYFVEWISKKFIFKNYFKDKKIIEKQQHNPSDRIAGAHF